MATIFGTSEDDILRGTRRADEIYGRQGDDLISGAQGRDFTYGGLNSDTIDGGVGNDVLHGEGGRDWLGGGWGNDLLFGDGGDDFLHDGGGADTVYGGYGSDTFLISPPDQSADLFDGGAGVDTLNIYPFNEIPSEQDYGVRINLRLGTLRIGDSVRDTIASIENVEINDSGGDRPGDDAVNGSAANNDIDVGRGNNVVYAGLGDDNVRGSGLLNGGEGNDALLGIGTLIGGNGDDTLVFTSDTMMSGGAGEDRFEYRGSVLDVDGEWVDGDGTILDYEAGERIYVGSGRSFVGETDDPGLEEIGYHREGDDTVIVALTSSLDVTIRLVGYTGPLTADIFGL